MVFGLSHRTANQKVPICRHLTSEAQSAVQAYADKPRRNEQHPRKSGSDRIGVKRARLQAFSRWERAFERIGGAAALLDNAVAPARLYVNYDCRDERLYDSGALRDELRLPR